MAAPIHDWYLKQWLRTLGKRQADIARDLEWNKARVSLTASGKQPYTRDDINEIADYLNLRPYELLMHPEDAMRMRRLRDEMMRLAHETDETGEDSRDKSEAPQKVSSA
ncbi:helix-turn-helix domain-containing protein [Qipengyuania atrilutea]|uniref:Helix-turn-helix transcriptional regulator n=1 Tax=Qipengyuania atrilutea TaxID=2744473 RepID=A0A850GXP3_9SPHN|nr:helix-turn-helix transcriptional regulator [Actirhodobacter atriluteus]NVD44364.1 helix-turn-helix transcriptional regulator [Actirhodobacter atriluteus]